MWFVEDFFIYKVRLEDLFKMFEIFDECIDK